MRALRRRISNAIYRQLVEDADAMRGSGWASGDDSYDQRDRLNPESRFFGEATARTPPRRYAPASCLCLTEGCQYSLVDLEVAAAAARFESALARYGVPAAFARFSGAELTALAISPPLSPELVSLYETRAPRNCELEFSPEQLRLYSPDELDERQRGYRAGNWQHTWLAIGDSSADPVIANTAKEGTPIAFAIHGIGEWKPRWVAPTLTAFLDALSDWVAVLYGQFGGEMLDEDLDFEIKPGFVDALRHALTASLPEECVRAWIDYVTT